MQIRLTALAAAVLLGASHVTAVAQVRAPAAAHDTSWVARSALYEVFVQDFTPEGNLPGVTTNLDRIAASGADVIWLMPLQPNGIERRKGSLGSRYAIRDYMRVDSVYGTSDDMKALVRAAHARGLKVILDWVPDHTAWDHPWVKAHPEYYRKDSTGALSVPVDPAGKPTDWTDVVMLDYGNRQLRREMIDAMRFWLQEYELDGFRMDVAGFVPYDFWSDAIAELRRSVPRRILMLAEWGDIELTRRGFDLIYGWDSYKRLKQVWRGASAREFIEAEQADLRQMPAGGGHMRFTTNHDETAWDQPPLTLFGGAASARAAFVASALLPGRPLLYAGQEVESPQKLGLFEREAVIWNQPDAEAARAHYRRVMELARKDQAFIAGDFRPADVSAAEDVIAYYRGDALVLVNVRAKPVRVSVKGPGLEGRRDLLTGRTVKSQALALPAYGAVVLARRAR